MKTLLIGIALLAGIASLPAAETPAPNYYELRIYDVTSNKLDGVVERFSETVNPVRQKHGIECFGYWTSRSTNGDKFIYLMAAASKEELQKREEKFGADPDFKAGYANSNKKHGKTVDKIVLVPLSVASEMKLDLTTSKTPRGFDLRIYSVLPGKLDAFRDRWRDHAVRIYERHGLHSIGWWVAEKTDAQGNDRFIVLLAGGSFDTIQKSISEFHKDVEWQGIEKETEKDGKLRSGVEAFKMKAADFSPIK